MSISRSMEEYFKEPFIIAYFWIAGFVLIVAILIKLGNLIVDHCPVLQASDIDPSEISECLQTMNLDILNHLNRLEEDGPVNICKLSGFHDCDRNIRGIVAALAEHVKRCFKDVTISKRDVFISLYLLEEGVLNYLCHHDYKRDWVKSKRIPIDSPEFAQYESVKCIKSGNSTCYLLSKNGYAKGNSKRHKTIKQYLGCKLESNGFIYGFLTVEFHNESVFTDELQMQEFMENNIFPYKTLIEYQFLKKQFFGSFSDFENNWRTA
ncbi:hypothetical protein [Desulfovibrio sp. JC022]|uniref:hypothetical protein n=1 Tax=Desulfovibrio sp. JC022 TaxID=2593642 RepID=UPI0013D1BAC8|nr:hypothetical protein [Desulfovibrio sp. JC022]NDV21576.1 hypothetical protein [Desulfovibrio sp. JC022]